MARPRRRSSSSSCASCRPGAGFLVAAGLEQVLDFLENLRFSPEELDWLATHRAASARTSSTISLSSASPATSTPCPRARSSSPTSRSCASPRRCREAQLVETRLINLLHFQTLIASKAARMVLAAPGKLLVDFGLRRAHGAEAGLLAARASYLAGFAGTATVLAEQLFGIPIFGTMAHSFIQAHDDEASRLRAFRPLAAARTCVLLIDTYDTEAAARKVVALAPRLKATASRSAACGSTAAT